MLQFAWFCLLASFPAHSFKLTQQHETYLRLLFVLSDPQNMNQHKNMINKLQIKMRIIFCSIETDIGLNQKFDKHYARMWASESIQFDGEEMLSTEPNDVKSFHKHKFRFGCKAKRIELVLCGRLNVGIAQWHEEKYAPAITLLW